MSGRQQERRKITLKMISAGIDVLYKDGFGSDSPMANGSDQEIMRRAYLAMLLQSLSRSESVPCSGDQSEGPIP